MTDLPHFALPFRFDRGSAVVVEQDSTDDVVACCTAVLLCPVGFRAELPEFGIEDPTFSQGQVDADTLVSAVRRWEPRAEITFAQEPDAADELVLNVTAAIGVPSID
jgi:phage baseplate assembly protein W